jgi:hypothetical protein
VSSSQGSRNSRPPRISRRAAVALIAALTLAAAHWCQARPFQQDPNRPAPPEVKAEKYAKPEDKDRPQPVPEFKLERTLKMVPVPRDRQMFNVQMVNTSLLPRDKQGIWVLDFSYKPLRLRTVPIPGKGRRQIHYLYYKVVNRTGKPQMFVPQFIMVNEKGKKFEDEVIPEAIPIIQQREEPSIPILGAVDMIGVLSPSTKPNVDDAVFGVACWDRWDATSDRFSIYVRGLSDGYKEFPAEGGGKPVAKYKTLRLDFIRRGDEHNLNEKEIQLADPPYEWVYW